MPISDTALVVFVVLSLLIGYLVEPFVVAAVRYSVKQARRIRLPQRAQVSKPRPLKCTDCVQMLAPSLKLFPKFDYQPLCFACIQKRERGEDFPWDTFNEAAAYYRRMSVPCAVFKPGPHF